LAKSPILDTIIELFEAIPPIGEDIDLTRSLMTGSDPAPLPEGVSAADEMLGGRRSLRIEPEDHKGTLLWLHGGGYCIGSPELHRGLGVALALASQRVVHLLDYRLAPEDPYPAALDDAVAATRSLITEHGAENVCIGGDSAGGGLCIATEIVLGQSDEPAPKAAVCISPWADLTLQAASITERAELDPMLSPAGLANMAACYLGDTTPLDPLASPVLGDLTGLAPHLIMVGTREVLHDDAQALTQALHRDGVPAVLSVWDDMIHVFPMFTGALPEADEAISMIAAFLDDPLPIPTETDN
jgi:monoterpene epsilon-lactone hydrolase